MVRGDGMTASCRVLWISPKLPLPLVSGDKIRQYNLIRRLAARHEIHLVCFLDRPEDADLVAELGKVCGQVIAVPLPRREPLTTRALRSLHPWTPFYVQRYQSLDMRQAVQQALSHATYHVVQVEHIYMSHYFDRVAPANGAARVLTLHNLESTTMTRCAAVEPNALKRVYWRHEARKLESLERQSVARVDAAVVMSATDRERILAMAPSARVSIVENGVDTDAYAVADHCDHDASVLFTGSLGYRPNAEAVEFFLRRVWPSIRRRAPTARFVVVGRDPSPALEGFGGRDGVVVTGEVEDVRPYFTHASVVVVPIRAGSGTRLKILEAMASGCAIVSTTTGAEGLDVRHDAELVLADEPEAFASATVELLGDAQRRRRLGAAARSLAERRYDWTFATAAMNEVYAHACERAAERAAARRTRHWLALAERTP